MDRRYLVRAQEDLVELWSTARLQFEPKGWQMQMRADLRDGLAGMVPRPHKVLHAIYGAGDTGEFVDIENVLLYNVGARSIRGLMTTGVRFERAYTTPAPSVDLQPGTALHYQRYVLTDRHAGFFGWHVGQRLASLRGVRVTTVDKPGVVWAAIRAQTQPPDQIADSPCRFVARVGVLPPSTRAAERRSITDVIKPLLDGIVSAIHAHDRTPDADLITRLHDAGIGDRAGLMDELTDPRWAALGSRCVVRPFRDRGVQWNPADDYCVAAEVLVGDRAPGAMWEIDADLCAATAPRG